MNMVPENNTTQESLTTDRDTAQEVVSEYDNVQPEDSTLNEEWIDWHVHQARMNEKAREEDRTYYVS